MSKSDQLKAAIARIPQTADYARRIAGERNSPEAQAILALIGVIQESVLLSRGGALCIRDRATCTEQRAGEQKSVGQ